MRLHRELDPTSIRANLADGVLHLEIERHEAAKPRAIEVN
ncbi:MAG: Hsp20 family protein [Roseibacillus sp.]